MGDIAFALAFGTDIGVAIQNRNIPSILALIMRFEIDILYSVPTTHLTLASFSQQKRGADLSSLRLILSGGDRFPWQLVRDYKKLAPKAAFYNVYGPTEVTINCFSVRLDNRLELSVERASVPIGYCFDSLDHVLLDENSQPATKGELCVTGPQMMLGYHGDAELSESVFVTDTRIECITRKLYRTGDIGYYDNGLVYLEGRVDGLIKIRGYRIHPDEVSKTLDSIEEVDVSAVVNFGKQSDAALKAFIKLKHGSGLTVEDIEKFLREKLPDYMIPVQYELVKDFPLSQSGKIDKNSLAKRL
jgi:acyl-coenzyme A synthetase/AMP-(fatty) acid ligase